MQVFKDQPPKKPSLIPEDARIPILPIITPSVYYPPQFLSQMQQLANPAPLFYTKHDIHIGGPDADHFAASMIYEDAMPPETIFKSYKTLKERNNLSEYIRGAFIQEYDGEPITFDGGKSSLNSRLKFLELNPFNSNQYDNNPYTGLPRNLLIYSSCYPIIYDKNEASAQCKKNSIGINIRLYALSLLEAFFIDFKDENFEQEPQHNPPCTNYSYTALSNSLSNLNPMFVKDLLDCVKNKNRTDYDVWRELYYYAYIRNVISKKFISPNFLKAYCLFIHRDSKIKFPNYYNLLATASGTPNSICENTRSNKVLVLLTESPNYNLYTWSSDLYEMDRNIQKQLYIGFKTNNRWKSVIAQIVTVFYVMSKYKFTINKMSLSKNFYIKDVPPNPDTTQYWKYNIDGIDYFIPNHGDLVLFDTDFHDINNKDEYKICGEFLLKCDNLSKNGRKMPTINVIESLIRINALECLTPNAFGQAFTSCGGVIPPTDIMELLGQIHTDINNGKTYEEIMKIHFTDYVHNRVGTTLRQSEISYVKKIGSKSFRKGELVIYEPEYEKYEIVIYIQDCDTYTCTCIRRINGILTQDNIGKDILYHYSNSESIYQDSSAGQSAINASYIIESYVL